MIKQVQTIRRLQDRKRILGLLVAVVVLYLVIPRLGGFAHTWPVLRHAEPAWLGLGLVATVATYLAAAEMYLLLAVKRLSIWPTLVVQLAGNFTNRLVPAGIGAIGISYDYLRKSHHDAASAGAAVATNNVLGFVGNGLIIFLLLVSGKAALGDIHLPTLNGIAVSILILIAAAVALFIVRARFERLRMALDRLLHHVARYRDRPVTLLAALITSLMLTASYVLVLMFCAAAVQVHLPFAATLIIMTLGVAGATVTPTPGGLGGAEVALMAGLVAYGVPAGIALAIMLLYRLFTFWLPLVFGGPALLYARRRRFI